ncbi:hypothetical protein E1B28_002098 [Marasmius oreades]|uniref:Uncharacterized protein n=1 Tax=Marasmius oreades TaxID=181124 RepID=A0A9P7RM78_9AGAR|nr:uncharacterized protein E1B28_002098 [Marasmius oreades]KAG7086139.1 hypothetical protein E1B28_002098 [Marasmius oreades]
MGCRRWELWVDPKQGNIIHGVDGPFCSWQSFPLHFQFETPLSSIEILQEDLLLCFLAHFPQDRKLDKWVLDIFQSLSGFRQEHSPTDFQSSQPVVISTLTNSIIAVGSTVWRTGWPAYNVCGVQMHDGSTRFNAEDLKNNSVIESFLEPQAWLSQSSSIFYQHGILLDKDLSQYKLIVPHLTLYGSWHFEHQKSSNHDNKGFPYLFLLPTPVLPSSAITVECFWSYDETGKTHIPEHSYHSLGLPTKMQVHVNLTYMHYWSSTKVYTGIHQWQHDRGFNPETTDFACSLGYPVFKVTQPKLSQFEELDKDDTQPKTVALGLSNVLTTSNVQKDIKQGMGVTILVVSVLRYI